MGRRNFAPELARELEEGGEDDLSLGLVGSRGDRVEDGERVGGQLRHDRHATLSELDNLDRCGGSEWGQKQKERAT